MYNNVQTEKSVKVSVKDSKIYIHFIGEPIKPVKKALKENGFKNKKSIYVADVTPFNRFFIKLLTGKDF